MDSLTATVSCKVCLKWITDFDSSPFEDHVTTAIFPRWMRDSAQEGCPICSAFVQLYSPISTCNRGDLINIRQTRGNGSSVRSRIVIDMESDAPFLATSVFCGKDLPCPWGIFPPGNEIRSSSGQDSCMRVVSNWIQNCVKNHDCGSTGDTQALPSRLIQIGKNVKELKLVEMAGKNGRYICLSHCWGVKRTFETQKENLADRLIKIEYDEMPRTYQDAVTLAKMIGVSYIWIDSLCILQNDRDDWLREAAKMADIYSRCFVTLAATSASTNSAGMFHTIADKESRGVTKEGLIYRLLTHTDLSHPNMTLLYGEERQFPLLNRAWVFQERLLSPRVLHFGPSELLWECHKEFSCECGDSDDIGLSKAGYTKILAQQEERRLALSWHGFVEQYSTKRLTRPSDKLPALSGIAKQFGQQRLNHTYLAGLWRSSLIEDLVWINGDSEYEIQSKLKQWRAPSWSWASIDGRIRYPTLIDYDGSSTLIRAKKHALVQHAECVVEGHNDYGEVTSGKIKLNGPTLRGHIIRRKRYDSHEYDMFLGQDRTTGHFSTQHFVDDEGVSFSMKTREHRIYFDHRSDDSRVQQPQPVEVLCLRIARMESIEAFSLRLREYGLILVGTNEEKREYRRIGMSIIEEQYQRARKDGEEPPRGEERFKPVQFIEAEKTAFWQDLKSPFVGTAVQQTIDII